MVKSRTNGVLEHAADGQRRLPRQWRKGGLVVAAALAASLVAVGCGSSDSTDTSSTASATVAASTAPAAAGTIADKYKNKTIGIAGFADADEGEATMTAALKEAAKKAGLDWKFKVSSAQANPDRVGAELDAFITQKVNAIVQYVTPADAVEPQLAAAKKANIPVFGMWTFSDLNPNMVVDYSPVPAVDTAALAHYMFSDLYRKHPTGDIPLALINTDAPVLAARPKVIAAINQLYPRVKVVDQATVDLKDAVGSATQITNAFMAKHPDLMGIWANYPPSGVPAAAAVAAKGKAKQISVYMHIGGKAGLQALKDKSNPLQGMPLVDLDYQAYQIVQEILTNMAGKPIDRLLSYEDVVPIRLFTKDTAAQADGAGVAGGDGWTRDGGAWKDPKVASWKQEFGS